MDDIVERKSERVGPVDEDAQRVRAHEFFAASVQDLVVNPIPFAALGVLDDLEMMEAATELARQG